MGEEQETGSQSQNLTVTWIPASKIEILSSQIERSFEPDDYTEETIVPGCKLKLIRSKKALDDLIKDNWEFIIEAESQHSDLIPAKYEGGLKIWECSYDLGKYIFENNILIEDKVILDLGCGAGIIGLIGLRKNSVVSFQDYNFEVIKSLTIPNVLLNCEDRQVALDKCEFYQGDWESFTQLSPDKKYDFIFSSETIYNSDNHRKLYEVFKGKLKPGGFGYIAGKSYYFGVGGGMRQFQSLIEEDGFFDVQVVWRSKEGLQREILKIMQKQS